MNVQLTSPRPSPARTELDTQKVYQAFLKGEAKATVDHLAYQDKGIDLSPYKGDISSYPARLKADLAATPTTAALPYPKIGEMPSIDNSALSFLDPNVTNACVAVGSWEDGALHTKWLGRQATAPVQQWSSTKMLPMTRVAEMACKASPTVLLDETLVKDPTGSKSISLAHAYDDIVSYRAGDDMSNSLARMFKQFDTPKGIEDWLHHTTGNPTSVFRGGYGANSYIKRPELISQGDHKVILKASGADHVGDNLVSSYDLCRMVSQIGWHDHLSTDKQLAIPQNGIDTLVRGLGTDSARYGDVALDALGLSKDIHEPVFISKLGFGMSDQRHQFEQVYTAFIQFKTSDEQPHSLALSLRAAKKPDSPRAAMELDAKMATQVTAILHKLMQGEL